MLILCLKGCRLCKMKKYFYLFRHGETTYNVGGFVQGQTNNSVLTEKGVEQAFRVGEILKNYPIDVLVSSPLKRAQQTAQEVLKSFSHLPLLTDERFTEVNVGEIEGLHYTKVQEKFNEKYLQWRSLDEKYLDLCFLGGEKKRQVRTRLMEALNYYAEQTPYQYIAVAGHGILLTQALLALGQEAVDVKNGSILFFTYEDNKLKFEKII